MIECVMKSSQDAKVETAFNYAFNFYKQNGRSLNSQESCIQQIETMTGFDRATSIEIQAPVLSILMYNDTMDIANQVIQQHLNIVTGIIRSRLLDINHGNVQEEMKEQAQVVTKYVSKTPSYTAQEMVGWLEHTNNTQNLEFNLPYKEINLSGKSVTNEDMVFFAQRMSNFAFHLDSLQLNHNPIGDYGIQALFNCAFTVPLGRSVVHLTLNNCNFGDVGAELIAAYVRDGYMTASSIDVSGNNITQTGWESFAVAVKSVQAKSVAIKVATTSTLQEMKEFLTKGFNYYAQSRPVFVDKEFADELAGVKLSSCEKTKINVKESFWTGVVITSLTTGNDAIILLGGAKAGAGALLSQDTFDCVNKLAGDAHDYIFSGE